MRLLIDGYNLLNATGIVGRGTRGTALERSRRALLHFLAGTLSEEEIAHTTIVFDSQGAPPGLPREEQVDGIEVLYAKGYAEADDLIEELIAAENVPRQLLVVSSDHRLQRAARRRRASFADSDTWIADLHARRRARSSPTSPPGKPKPAPGQIEHWLSEFADIDVDEIRAELHEEGDARSASETSGETTQKSREAEVAEEKDSPPPLKEGLDEEMIRDAEELFPPDYGRDIIETQKRDDPLDPFPPGYGEDVIDEERP